MGYSSVLLARQLQTGLTTAIIWECIADGNQRNRLHSAMMVSFLSPGSMLASEELFKMSTNCWTKS